MIRCVAFTPNGNILASGGDDHTAILWDGAERRRLGDLKETDAVTSVDLTPTARRSRRQRALRIEDPPWDA
jgi:WD40 repeat protein